MPIPSPPTSPPSPPPHECGCTMFLQGLTEFSSDKVVCKKVETETKIACMPAATKKSAKWYKRKETLVEDIFSSSECLLSDFELCLVQIPPPYPPGSPPQPS